MHNKPIGGAHSDSPNWMFAYCKVRNIIRQDMKTYIDYYGQRVSLIIETKFCGIWGNHHNLLHPMEGPYLQVEEQHIPEAGK
jgi:hypothetical protein